MNRQSAAAAKNRARRWLSRVPAFRSLAWECNGQLERAAGRGRPNGCHRGAIVAAIRRAAAVVQTISGTLRQPLRNKAGCPGRMPTSLPSHQAWKQPRFGLSVAAAACCRSLGERSGPVLRACSDIHHSVLYPSLPRFASLSRRRAAADGSPTGPKPLQPRPRRPEPVIGV